MATTMNKRIVAIGLVTILATIFGFFTYRSSAANAAELFVLGTTQSNSCGSNLTTAGYQDEQFGLVLRQFWDNEEIVVSFTFPDGRVFSPTVADGRVSAPVGLDGLVDMPTNFPWVASVSNGGDYYYTFLASKRWPYGCYNFSAYGLRSGRQAQGGFALLPRVGAAPNAGPAVLSIEDNTTGDPSGLHGSTANIFGRGFRGQERVDIWITAPDGAVIDYPSQFTSDVGSFESTFVFDERFSTGRYAFTALGKSSGYQVIGYFNLASRPSQQSGWARLRVAWRYPATARQDQQFEIQGQYFDPYEQISVWATLPDGSVHGLPIQQANEFGEFYSLVGLDTRLPTGLYSFTAQGLSTRRLVITQLDVDPGSQNVTDATPNLDQAPFVVDSNSGNLNTLGDQPQNLGVPSVDPAPEFQTDTEPAPLTPTW